MSFGDITNFHMLFPIPFDLQDVSRNFYEIDIYDILLYIIFHQTYIYFITVYIKIVHACMLCFAMTMICRS